MLGSKRPTSKGLANRRGSFSFGVGCLPRRRSPRRPKPGSTLDVCRNHGVELVFADEPLLIVVLVLSIFSASFLFFGSSANAFCHDSNASGTRSNFR